MAYSKLLHIVICKFRRGAYGILLRIILEKLITLALHVCMHHQPAVFHGCHIDRILDRNGGRFPIFKLVAGNLIFVEAISASSGRSFLLC